MRGSQRYTRGLGLIGAIFLITMIALLSMAITRSVRTGADGAAIEMLAARAFWAAEAGAQLGVRSLIPVSGAPQCTAQAWNMAPIGYAQCQASITCTQTTVAGTDYHHIRSNGRCGIGTEMVAERVVEVLVQ